MTYGSGHEPSRVFCPARQKPAFPWKPSFLGRAEDGLNHISEVLVNASVPIIMQLLPVVGLLRPPKQAQCGQMKSYSDCKPTVGRQLLQPERLMAEANNSLLTASSPSLPMTQTCRHLSLRATWCILLLISTAASSTQAWIKKHIYIYIYWQRQKDALKSRKARRETNAAACDQLCCLWIGIVLSRSAALSRRRALVLPQWMKDVKAARKRRNNDGTIEGNCSWVLIKY